MISIDLRFIHYLGAKVRLFGDKRLFTSYHNMFKISENNRIWFSISLIGLLAFSNTLLQNLLQVISRAHSQLLSDIGPLGSDVRFRLVEQRANLTQLSVLQDKVTDFLFRGTQLGKDTFYVLFAQFPGLEILHHIVYDILLRSLTQKIQQMRGKFNIMPFFRQSHVCLNLLFVYLQHLEQFFLITLQRSVRIDKLLTVSGNSQTQHADKKQYEHHHEEIIHERFIPRYNHTQYINPKGYSHQPACETRLISRQREKHVA